tara:strand:- start:33457 stop:34185 length:729 start_codon:yes stop_codon:yes gene_type:complete
MNLDDFIFLGAETSRSIVYLEKFASLGMRFSSVIILKNLENPFDYEGISPNTKILESDPKNIHTPSFKKNIEILASEVSDDVTIIKTDSVNDPNVLKKIKTTESLFTIYSGFGGQIVSKELLLESRFLHAHAGWLPQYRGSTTIYYSIIDNRECAVSVIELKPEIDTGDILSRKRYQLPRSWENIDHVYDNQIRADLISKTLSYYSDKGEFDMILSQNDRDSSTYYVIHPVLKHLAILSLDN